MASIAPTKTTTKRVDRTTNTVFRSAAHKDKEKDPTQSGLFKAALKSMRVSKPDDPEEKEADDTAEKVLRMPADKEKEVAKSSKKIAKKEKDPEINKKQKDEEIQRKAEEPEIQRQEEEEAQCKLEKPEVKRKEEEQIARKATGNVNMKANVQADINRAMSDGSPLPLSVKKFMEPRFGANFEGIKIHTDSNSAKLNRRLSARAFAYKNHVFFGENQFQPNSDDGKRLIAHELTHSIQQGAAKQNAATQNAATQNPAKQNTSTAQTQTKLRRSEIKAGANTNARVQAKATVKQSAPPSIQRLGIQDALDFFADKAYFIPGFRMLCILIGVNPINMSRVERSAANILRAIVEFLPGGALITTVLDRYGIFESAGNWINERLNSLAITSASLRRSLMAFLDSLSWSDIFDLDGVWERAKRIFTEPINTIINFARSVFNGLLRLIKDAVLTPLAQWASRTRGWDLLCAVLGRNPITGEVVERNAENLIGGFMKFIGQEEVWKNIKRANAIPRAWAWFQGALAGVRAFVVQVPQMLMAAFEALQVADLLNIPAVFARIMGTFANFAFTFVRWAGAQVMELLKIIFEVVAPGLMPYLRRARAAFTTIIRNPIQFVRNLINAGVLGFRRFATNFLTHLRASFINWLTGSLQGTGVHIPTSFSLKEIIKFVLSVLGITWQNIRLKLVRAVGEPAVNAMERGFEIVKTLITEGPAALWEQIKTSLANLRDMVIERIMNFVMVRIVQAAVMRIVSMLNPAGAFVQAIIAIYNTIMFFVERMRTIMQVARSFLNSIMNIAEGKLQPAARRVEQTMAGMLTLVISFLARLMGLGGISGRIQSILARIRAPIDRAMDRAVTWVVSQARRIGGFILQAGVPRDPQERLRRGLNAAELIVRRMPRNQLGEAIITRALAVVKTRYGFRTLIPRIRDGRWFVFGQINPEGEKDTGVATDSATPAQATANMPDTVDVLDSSDRVRIRNYSRENRSGDFAGGITDGGNVTLSKVKFRNNNTETIQPVGSSVTINYSISDANSKFPAPPRIVGIVDSSNPEEESVYADHRKAFGSAKRRWWRGADGSDTNMQWLIDKGWLLPGDKKGLQKGARKWSFIHTQFNADERAHYGRRAKNKDTMMRMFDQHPDVYRVDTLYQAWDERISEQTEIHHLLPLDFGGTNSQTFIPLSRGMHTKDGNSIHLSFWNPMKRWLLGLRSASR